MLAYERCARAMFQTTLIGGLGLSVFAISTFTPTQRFGYMMLTLLTAAIVGDLLFLPALLCGPAGRFFGKQKTPKTNGSDEAPVDRQPDNFHKPTAAANSRSQKVATRHDRPHRSFRE